MKTEPSRAHMRQHSAPICGSIPRPANGGNVVIINLTRFGDLLQSQALSRDLHRAGLRVGRVCLVNFAWLVNQKYFKELTDSDVYSQLKKDYDDALQEDVPIFGFISTGPDDTFDDDGLRL